MKLDKNSGVPIKESQAIALTHAYQSKRPKTNKAYFIGSDLIKKIMGQKNCIGIRIYNGFDTKTEENNRVLVGVNAEGEDMVEGIIGEELIPCPDNCSRKISLMK